ncbi:MAG: hypothetical protein IJF03_00810 [Lachnospiraceae bacterium]|nr:hypothetical protein [Lachnospiraceae bacterium]
MDKYEYRIKAEQIRKLAEQEDYVSAMKIANTIDWNRVRSIPMLCLIGEIYEKNNMLEESRDVMLIAYDRHPYGRMIIYTLAELSIRLEDYIDAVEYYKEFVQVAPRDTGRYILQYKLYEAQEVGLKERIAVLEEFKRHEYVEKWAFELAYLYHRASMSEQCVAECDELILWFSEGKYVEKAMELKMLYQPLTEEQQKKYDSRNDVQIEKSIAAVEAVAERAMEEEPEINVKPMNYGIYDTVNLQKELAKSMQQILEATEKETVDTTMNNIKKLVQESKIEGLVDEKKPGETKELPNIDDNDPEMDEMEKEDADVMAEAAKLIGQITSVSGVRRHIESEEFQDLEIEEDELVGKDEPESDLDSVAEEVNDDIPVETPEDLEKTKEFILHITDAPTKIIPVKEVERELQKKQPEIEPEVIEVEEEPETQPEMNEEPQEVAYTEFVYNNMLSEERDGQISICVPDEDIVEKQITGQMSIEEVLQEWERVKAEAAEEKQKVLEEAKEKAIAETEDIMDRLADVVPTITEEMQKMMEDRESSEEMEQNHEEYEEGLQTLIEETNIFEDMEDAIMKEAEAALKSMDEPDEEDVEEEQDLEEAVLESLEAQEELDELDDFGKEEEPEDEDVVEELESRLSADLPEGIESIAREEEEENPMVMEADAESFKRIFKYFTEIDGVSDQIVSALESIDEISDKGNIIIMGDSATGKTTLAVDIIKAAKKSRNITGNKVARITGEAMNQKEVDTVMENAAGGVLIIESAADMNKETVQNFSKILDERENTILVIVEDTKERMLKLLESDNGFRNKFTAKIDLPPYTNTDLVAFAKSYAIENDCKIDDMGVLALYSRLAEIQFETDTIPSLADVKEMVDDAIINANKKSLKNMFGTLISKRYDDEHYMILKEKDFV